MGWEYRGRYVRQGTVVYCAFEGAHGYKKRFEALRRHYNINDKTAVPLYLMPGRANLAKEHAALITDIRAQTEQAPPIAVVLDTLNKSLVGSESKDADMADYIRAAEGSTASSSSCTIAATTRPGRAVIRRSPVLSTLS